MHKLGRWTAQLHLRSVCLTWRDSTCIKSTHHNVFIAKSAEKNKSGDAIRSNELHPSIALQQQQKVRRTSGVYANPRLARGSFSSLKGLALSKCNGTTNAEPRCARYKSPGYCDVAHTRAHTLVVVNALMTMISKLQYRVSMVSVSFQCRQGCSSNKEAVFIFFNIARYSRVHSFEVIVLGVKLYCPHESDTWETTS